MWMVTVPSCRYNDATLRTTDPLPRSGSRSRRHAISPAISCQHTTPAPCKSYSNSDSDSSSDSDCDSGTEVLAFLSPFPPVMVLVTQMLKLFGLRLPEVCGEWPMSLMGNCTLQETTCKAFHSKNLKLPEP